MKIKLTAPYRSLNSFESEELPPFTVITGKNGSGKTQLLEILENKIMGKREFDLFQLETDPPITRIQVEGIEKESSVVLDINAWKERINPAVHHAMVMKDGAKRLLWYMHQNNLQFDPRKPVQQGTLLSEEPTYKELVGKAHNEIFGSGIAVNSRREYDTLQAIYGATERWVLPLIIETAVLSGKSIEALEANDFYRANISERYLDRIDLFSSQFEVIFYNYAKRRNENRQNYFYQKEDGMELGAISDKEFVKQHTPPWEIINAILKDNGLDFEFQEIKAIDFKPELQLDFKLLKRSTGVPIAFNHLSSGEKVIIGLVIKLFTSQYYANCLEFPELLILDEPDAHLHPEMTQLLLNVLEGTFVNKLGMKVIVTTHPPSTVALASEESIYELKNQPVTSLRRISKDDGLKLLTGFLPTLAIDYKNHHQVFVESPTDVEYFQSLLFKHGQHNKMTFKLYFICNPMGKGSSSVVYDLVNQIRGSGNVTTYGIVDWDLKNADENSVYVHGKEERYSVENFLLDPLYLIALLLSMKNAHGIAQIVGVSENEIEYTLGHKSQSEVQRITDAFFAEIAVRFPALVDRGKLTAIRYQNGHVVQWPAAYCEAQGHDLENKLKTVFKALEKFRNEGEMQKELSSIMAKAYPFVPRSSIEVLERIAQPTAHSQGAAPKMERS